MFHLEGSTNLKSGCSRKPSFWSSMVIHYISYIAHSGQLFTATSKNPSAVNTICISSFWCIHLCKISIKINVVTEEDNCENETLALNKRWNWSSSTKLVLSVRWNHDLIAQLFRASEQNSLLVGPRLIQADFI